MSIHSLIRKAHFGIVIFLFLTLFLLIYFFASQFHKRFNFKSPESVTLSEETKSLLTRIKTPVTLKAFFSVDDSRLSALRGFLEECKRFKSDFDFEIIDPDQRPREAERYKIDQYGAVVIELLGRRMRTQGFGEEDLSFAISKLFSGKYPEIYFVKGHQEARLYDRSENGYSEFHKRLKSARYQIKDVELAKHDIPKSAEFVVLLGPHADLTQTELERLDAFLERGGKLLAAFDPVLPGEGERVRAWIGKKGIALGADVAVDGLGKELVGDYLVAAGVDLVEPEAFKGLDAPIFMPLARSVRKNPITPGNINVVELLRTSDRAWAETNLEDLGAGKTDFDEGLDYPGPISVAAISRIDSERQGMLIVLGDSEFVNNAHFKLGNNQAFMFKLIALALNERFEIKEQKTSPDTAPFILNQRNAFILFGATVIAMPILLVAIGFVFYFLRKQQA